MRQTLNHHFCFCHFLIPIISLQDSTDYDEDGFSNVFPLWRDFNPIHPRKWRVKSGVLFKNSDITYWGKKPTFYPKIAKIETLKNVNFVINGTLKLWILSNTRLWNCEFCQKWDFENVNFVKNDISKMWILSKMRLWNFEFCQKWDFENVNFVKNDI